MLRKSSPPIEPRRREAPITATLAGCEERAAATRRPRRGRAPRRARGRPRSPRSGRRSSTSPYSSSRASSKPASAKTASCRLVLGEHLGDEAPDPGLARAGGELLEQPRADAAAVLLVGDGEGDLGGLGVAQAHVARERDDPLRAVLVGQRADERAPLDPVRVEAGLDERCGRPRARRGSAGSGCGRTGASKKATSASTSAASGGRSRSVPPSRRMTSTASAVAAARSGDNRRLLALHHVIHDCLHSRLLFESSHSRLARAARHRHAPGVGLWFFREGDPTPRGCAGAARPRTSRKRR